MARGRSFCRWSPGDTHSRRQCGAQRAGRLGAAHGEFLFLGFLPEKAGARRSRLEDLAAEAAKSEAVRVLIFYEAPHRILETLADLEAVWGPSLRVVVARELTKIHEEFLRGTVAEARLELASRDRIRGEITLAGRGSARNRQSSGINHSRPRFREDIGSGCAPSG